MAGEVAEIEQAIGQENLARVLAGIYTNGGFKETKKKQSGES